MLEKSYILLKSALKNLRRNLCSSISCIAAILSMLFLLEFFLLLVINIRIVIIGVNSHAEIQILLKHNIRASDKKNIYSRVESAYGVTDIASVVYNTPRSVSYIVHVDKSDARSKIISQIQSLSCIKNIRYQEKVSNRIIFIIRIFQLLCVILFIVLMISSFFLIKNTIKLAIYPRINEIRIMQYVGASDSYIKCQFILEGIIHGLLGAVLSTIVIYFLYRLIYWQAVSFFADASIIFIRPGFILTILSWVFVIIGMILSVFGSLREIKKLLIF